MQRIYNLDQWTELREQEELRFAGQRKRNVRLDVNSPGESAIYIVYEGKARFLALVKGRDVIEFSVDGAFGLTCEGSSVHVFTADGDDISSTILEPRIFTRIAERRRRDPALEQMMYLMNQNMERRLAAQSAELERRYAAATAPVNPLSSNGGAGSAEPEPAGVAPAPTAPAGATEGGTSEPVTGEASGD